MAVVLHWFLPTSGDSRTDLSLGNAVGATGSRATKPGTERAPDIGYIGQIARSAEQLGLVRGGAGTALVGSREEVADRIAGYHELGIDEFILSATRTWKRPTRSARAYCRCCGAGACWLPPPQALITGLSKLAGIGFPSVTANNQGQIRSPLAQFRSHTAFTRMLRVVVTLDPWVNSQ